MADSPYMDRTPSLTNSDATSTSSASIRDPSPTPSNRRPLPSTPDGKPGVPLRPARAQPPMAAERPRSHVSSIVPPPPPTLADLLKHANILHQVLQDISWMDFRAIGQTCQGCRDPLFESDKTREVVLMRFVPGYKQSALLRDPQWFQDVPITISDLELLGE